MEGGVVDGEGPVPPVASAAVDAGRFVRSPAGLALLYVPFAIGVLLAFSATPDDALITMRYAANVVHGHGAVFNPGERVEGFTSPLHLLVSVLVFLVPGGHALLKAKAASIAFGVLALWAGARLLRAADLSTWALRLGLVLLGGSFIVSYAAVNAMETTLACWLVTTLLVLLVTGQVRDRWVISGLVAGAAVLTRPDALLLVAGLAVTSFAVDRTAGFLPRIRWVLLAAAMVALSVLVRWSYYGELLPNTYYAKSAPRNPETVLHGLQYVFRSLVGQVAYDDQVGIRSILHPTPILGFVLLGVLLLVHLVGVVAIVRSRRELLYAPVAVVLAVTFAVVQGGDWVVGARFLAPVWAAAVLVELVALESIVAWMSQRNPNRAPAVRWAGCGLLGLALVLPYAVYHSPIWATGGRVDDVALIEHGPYGFSPVWPAAVGLLDCAAPGDLVAYSQVGLSGFSRQDLRLLDQAGLVSSEIARSAPTSDKSSIGVSEADWQDPQSNTGRILLRERPKLIVTAIGQPEPSVLGGAYVLDETVQAGDFSVMRYRRADVTCP